MKKKLSLAALAGAAVAAAALGAFALAHHGSRAVAKAAPADPNAVGVEVHGRWTLQVRSPAGRVVRTYRFHNDLYPGFGSARIANALLGPPSVAPSDCDETTQNGYSVFTSRILPSIVAVLAGQQVLVTVDLTFS